ncbi:MAG: hypothetical protein V9G29_12105 [Burkholderiaceae bacterium]
MTFASLGLTEALTKAVADAGYENRHRSADDAPSRPPSPARDLMVASSAPAAARRHPSSCPALERILAARADTDASRRERGVVYGPRVLVLAPTRELAHAGRQGGHRLRPPRAGPARRHRRRRRALPGCRSRRCAGRWTS